MDTNGPNSNISQTEQDQSSPRYKSSKNESSHKDDKGHTARITKSNKTNKQPSPPFKSIKTHKHQLETPKNQYHRLKSGNQHSTSPKNQDNKDLVGLNVGMINDVLEHWDMVTEPPQKEADSSDDTVKKINVSGGQTPLK